MYPSRLLTKFCRIAATAFSILGGSALQVWAQNAAPCLNATPSFVPFHSVYYITAPNANGDRLVVGSMSLENYSALRSQVPAPSAPNQQFCSPIQLLPGLYAQAYVPTAAEQAGDFSNFQGLLLDPRTYSPSNPSPGHMSPFPGGIIPMSVIPDPFAWRVRTVPTEAPATYAGLRFVPVTPCRVADTRNADGPFGGPMLTGQTTHDFAVPQSACGIPVNAQAYSLNFTVVPLEKLNYITAFPTGQPQPATSTLNSYDGRVKANAAIVPAGANGGVSVFATNNTHLIIDINGYFVPASDASALAFYPLPPCRLVDTRYTPGPLGAPSLVAKQERVFPVLTSACHVPASAQAYSLNYTVVPKGPLEYLTTWPAGQTRPEVSTLNALTGVITANAAIVPAGENGDISVYATQETALIVDINGYFAPPADGGLSLYSSPPCRVYDSRLGAQPLINTAEIKVTGNNCSAPVNARSYIFNTTVVPAKSLLYLTLWPHGEENQPNASVLNAPDGVVTSNLAIVPTTDGSINTFASDSTHLILDILGYFAP